MELWLGYARTIMARYAGLGALWVTVNEPTIYIGRKVIADGGVPADYVPTGEPAFCAASAPIETCLGAIVPQR